jgi:hypothetical protein
MVVASPNRRILLWYGTSIMRSLPCSLKYMIRVIQFLYLNILLICVIAHMVLHPMTVEILMSELREFGLCPFTSSMLTYVLVKKLPKIDFLKMWSILYDAPSWILISTSCDFMSLSKRNFVTQRAGNQVAGLGSRASDLIQEVLSSYLSQDTGYPDGGFLWFSLFPPDRFKDCTLT